MIKNRFFWSWDHSTNWCMNTPGSQNSGVGNEYSKNSEMFELDYTRAIDWCANHKMTAMGIVGMLRDRHGGVDSARRICEYALKKGTSVYIIAGLFAYGGIYYEGDHKYSLNKFFEKNPETIAKDKNGELVRKVCVGRGGTKTEYQGCASNEKLHEFVLESLDWLFREIPELKGIQMESSDTGVCDCPKCRERRGDERPDEPISLADMAAIYPDASETVRRVKNDALIICETYHHFLDPECTIFSSKTPSPDLKKLLSMPTDTFWQWKCDAMLRSGEWKSGDKMIENMRCFNHILRAHTGTQWWGGRHTLGIELIRKQCKLTYDSGLNSVSMFGEISPCHTNAEFNYLALEYFADSPHKSLKDFVHDVMSEKLGGKSLAERYYEMATLYRIPERVPAATMEIAKIAAGLSDYDQVRRWQYLANHLNTFYWEVRAGGSLATMNPRDADRPDEF